MTDEKLIKELEKCNFVIANDEKCAVAIQDVPEGFCIVAKGIDTEAKKIVELSKKLQKLIVETEDAPKVFYEQFETGVPFTKYGGFLIDIMEEFQLIKTGSKKVEVD